MKRISLFSKFLLMILVTLTFLSSCKVHTFVNMDIGSNDEKIIKQIKSEPKDTVNTIISDSEFYMNGAQAADDFAAAEKALKQALKRRSERAGFFNRTLDRNSPLPDHYGRVLQAVSYDSRACSDEELKFFRETLNNYLR